MATIKFVDVLPGLAAALTTATGRPWYVGDRIPADAAAPFGRLQSVTPGGALSGLQAFPTTVPYVAQLSAVGKTDEDAGWLLDAARAHLDTRTWPLAVSAVTRITGAISEGPPSAPIREGSLITVNEDVRLLIGNV